MIVLFPAPLLAAFGGGGGGGGMYLFDVDFFMTGGFEVHFCGVWISSMLFWRDAADSNLPAP